MITDLLSELEPKVNSRICVVSRVPWTVVHTVMVSTMGVTVSVSFLRMPMTVVMTTLTGVMVVAVIVGAVMSMTTMRFSGRCQECPTSK